MFERTFVLMLLFCALASGCASNRYVASELPRQYRARRIVDLQSLDLAKYASSDESQEVIAPGDRLKVVLNDGTQSETAVHEWEVSVDETGQTVLPNIGPVRLAGLSNAAAEKTVVQASLQRDVFLTPVVRVALEERRNRIITVIGAVKSPGPVAITRGSVSLADAIVRAGGLAEDASGVVSVSGIQGLSDGLRPMGLSTVSSTAVSGSSIASTPATKIRLDQTDPESLGQIMVAEGGVVHVEVAPQDFVRVMGVIRGQSLDIPYGQSLRLLDAISLAGGQTYSNWISDRVTISRKVLGSDQTIQIKASIRKARRDSQENLVLAPNDVVNVDENIMTFTLSTISGLLGAGFNASQIGAGL